MNNLCDFGIIGLGTMGRNFLLNVADHGFSAAGLDLQAEKVRALEEEAAGRPVRGTTEMAAFAAILRPPRRIMLLVPAGRPVDAVIDDLAPHLSPGDLIIDGGNSHYLDTERRLAAMDGRGFRFLGVGVSGGAEGARRGPSIMPGGDREAYELVRPLFEAVAAKVDGEPCVTYTGSGSAGHYVKMVHNGIEYGLMQLIAEAYDLMRKAAGATNEEIRRVFEDWNNGRLRSFLIEISADIFRRHDADSGVLLVDLILDKAKQKGTGKWTTQSAMDLGIPIPTIDAAVTMRAISAFKELRLEAGKVLPSPAREAAGVDFAGFSRQLEEALYFAFVVTYAQGLQMLAAASQEFRYGLDLAAIARIWRGGCIIRAGVLEKIRQAFSGEVPGSNILFSKTLQQELLSTLPGTRQVMQAGLNSGVPLLAFSSALQYFQAFYTPNLPLNLVQAQRDYFGAHTYERMDKAGVFTTDW